MLTCILLQAGEGAAEASASADSILEEQKKVILLHPHVCESVGRDEFRCSGYELGHELGCKKLRIRVRV